MNAWAPVQHPAAAARPAAGKRLAAFAATEAVLIALVKAGAFDALGVPHAAKQMLAIVAGGAAGLPPD